jgi:hypothetical protein
MNGDEILIGHGTVEKDRTTGPNRKFKLQWQILPYELSGNPLDHILPMPSLV